MTGGEHRSLADGTEIPALGFGVWQVPDGAECGRAVRWALEAGYRHIDTAQAYGNEGSVGRALRDSGIPREQVFITTKFYPARRDPVAEIEGSLRRLGVDQVDLYIIHWPQRGPTWAWPGMEAARERGFARSIGVSNFSAQELEQVIGDREHAADGQPDSVQPVRIPAGAARGMPGSCRGRRGVQPARDRSAPVRSDRRWLAERLGRTPAQVLLRWCVQRETIVLPKSTHQERIEANAQIFDFSLSEDDMATLDALDTTGGTDKARERKWW